MNTHTVRYKAFGSPCEIHFQGTSQADAEHYGQLAVAECSRIEQKYSRYRPDSILSQLNQSGILLDPDEETLALLNFADSLYEQSGGLFDISSGILRRLWTFDKATLPDAGELKQLVQSIGWTQVHYSPTRITMAPNMELDFGGFGKEYAVDRVAALLIEAGLQHVLIDFGGDFFALAAREDGSPWPIGIRHPRQSNIALATLGLTRGGLATSGDYERFFELHGRRYCHILNPKTGYPVQHWQSVSVLSSSCMLAGAFCTIAMLKQQEAEPWLEQQQLSVFLVGPDGQCSGSLS